MVRKKTSNQVSLLAKLTHFPNYTGDELQFDEKLKEQAQELLDGYLTSDDGINKLSSADILQAKEFLLGIWMFSAYLRELIGEYPELTLQVLLNDPELSWQNLIKGFQKQEISDLSEQELMTIIRVFKKQSSLLIALADLGKIWQLNMVVKCLSEVADLILQKVISWLFYRASLKGEIILPSETNELSNESYLDCGYSIIAMGKYGAYELNYSSDIDIIILYDYERINLNSELEPNRFFLRLSRNLVKIIQEQTADGYGYRVDLRLRPDPGSTNIAVSYNGACQYYESMGQNWERAAMIKARFAAGDARLGQEFIANIQPFIWRKYLDFAAINDIQAMKKRINAVKGHNDVTINGHNIKLGRGGIREIEFFAQAQQLITGGKNNSLRLAKTLEALKELATQKWITNKANNELCKAYIFLRNLEHRLQMVNDEQTHAIPSGDFEIANIAWGMGYRDCKSFSEETLKFLRIVAKHYGELFDNSAAGDGKNFIFLGSDIDPETVENLREMGFVCPEAIIEAIRKWYSGHYRATKTQRSRELLTEMLPSLLEAFAATGHPDSVFFTFDEFISDLPSGVQFFSLLQANHGLFSLIATLMGTAPKLVAQLSRKAKIFDVVLENDFWGVAFDKETILVERNKLIIDKLEYESFLNNIRNFVREYQFKIGVGIITRTLDITEAGIAYSNLADIAIGSILDRVEQEIVEKYGKVAGGKVAIVALGKFGGQEISATSDVDIMLIFHCDNEAKYSDGVKQLAVGQYYSRLTQRLISAISSPTSEGILYEVDMRLRPSGNSGPIATNINSFIEYHQKDSQTWEKMALTRARVICGDKDLAATIQNSIAKIIRFNVDRKSIAADITKMRDLIAKEKPARGIWDLKRQRGGIIDIEFICQYLQLANINLHQDIAANNGYNMLEKFHKSHILKKGYYVDLYDALIMFHGLSNITKLCLDGNYDDYSWPEGLKQLMLKTFIDIEFKNQQKKPIQEQIIKSTEPQKGFVILSEELENTFAKVMNIYAKVLNFA